MNFVILRKSSCTRLSWKITITRVGLARYNDLRRNRIMFLNRLHRKILPWLQQQSALWPLALGSFLGLSLGAGALWGIGGLLGTGVCLVVLGALCWRARNAEPVLVGVDTVPALQELPSNTAAAPEPEPVPPVEPLDMVELAGDTFWMGSPDTDAEAYDYEKPQHAVSVSAFAISRYPITRQLYREICRTAPAAWERDSNDDRLPANAVTWFEAVAFCNALSEYIGLQPCYRVDGEHVEWDTGADGYRLPTEAEWEYACRARTTSKWFCGDDPSILDRYAWFSANANIEVQPVGEKLPNPWGLHDMCGNVWEWCWDWYNDYRREAVTDPTGPESGQYRVLRGGSAWDHAPGVLRSAFRVWDEPADRGDVIGFRCVRRPRRQL